jgi:hypothetical protein
MNDLCKEKNARMKGVVGNGNLHRGILLSVSISFSWLDSNVLDILKS